MDCLREHPLAFAITQMSPNRFPRILTGKGVWTLSCLRIYALSNSPKEQDGDCADEFDQPCPLCATTDARFMERQRNCAESSSEHSSQSPGPSEHPSSGTVSRRGIAGKRVERRAIPGSD